MSSRRIAAARLSEALAQIGAGLLTLAEVMPELAAVGEEEPPAPPPAPPARAPRRRGRRGPQVVRVARDVTVSEFEARAALEELKRL